MEKNEIIKLIERIMKDSLKKNINIDDVKNESLLKMKAGFSPSDLMILFFEIEKLFDIRFDRDEIINTRFDRITEVVEILQKKCNV